jgi:hypothetical protein
MSITQKTLCNRRGDAITAIPRPRSLEERRVAVSSLTGSGIETVAHLRENSRIVLMFCAFEGPPQIVRLHGRASRVSC